jgi:DNA sulfur modification protein DndB
MGVLRLTGTERIFAIDGQHRIEGIKQAIGDERQLENEQLAVIFVAHHTDASGKQRTRRLFSTLNRYAKPVSKGEIVALDEDDAFAIVTRRLVEEYPALMGDRVAYSRTTPIPPGNASAITTILGLYDLVVTLEVSLRENRKQRLRELTALRPPRDVIDAVYRKQVELWEALVRYVRPIAQCVRADAREGVARRYRTNEGGHLLFRPAGQKVFGQAVRVLMDRNLSIQDAVAQLSRAPMMLQDQFWHGVLWDPNAQRMVTRNAKLGQNLLLFATRHASEPRDYDLREEYRRATGRDLPRRRRM